ncbi:ADP-ribosylglycohydrolase family protein [Streptomyces sp. NBC_01190]|uniref:ADP-ribosylglycohydrolase family protein n=1 Tax=Streptomyces sp. NBC_01190 TaxID=2903767 RepID=UPI003864EFAD
MRRAMSAAAARTAPPFEWRRPDSARREAVVNERAAGNGALMGVATSGVYFAGYGRAVTMDAGRRLSALTHGDPAA